MVWRGRRRRRRREAGCHCDCASDGGKAVGCGRKKGHRSEVSEREKQKCWLRGRIICNLEEKGKGCGTIGVRDEWCSRVGWGTEAGRGIIGDIVRA